MWELVYDVPDDLMKHFAPTPAEPTAEPTADPTADPTHVPTPTPTEVPTHGPTELPTFEPSPAPTSLPTTRAPTGCIAGGAKMHILFKAEAPSRASGALAARAWTWPRPTSHV
jgi:hypothetical protein